MSAPKSTFALFFGNRGMFPSSLLKEARQTLSSVLNDLGYGTLMMDETATRYGAVETPEEGRIYAKWLDDNRGKFDGVILCLPNFGDENGALMALKNAGVPIFVQACPDDLDKMAPALRRDAFCGKFSILDVFWQAGIKYTIQAPHTVALDSDRFKANVDYFDRVCRVVKGMKDLVIGAIGARTTAFKTVRFDEVALQRHGVTVESFDLSDIFARHAAVDTSSDAYKAKADRLKSYTNWGGTPDATFERLARLGLVLDELIDEVKLDAIALRCWVELEQQLNISPCVLLSEMNDRNITAACEVDVLNALAMQALSLAADTPPTCLDWNNNYGDDDDKCILFHCGPTPKTLMSTPGEIVDHAILRNVVGEGCAVGCNVGRIKPMPCTISSMLTDSGKITGFIGEGKFTDDLIATDFFGCAGVYHQDNLQNMLNFVGRKGYRHHVSVVGGHVQDAVLEALNNYLGYEIVIP